MGHNRFMVQIVQGDRVTQKAWKMVRVRPRVLKELRLLKEYPSQSHNKVLEILLGIVPKDRADRAIAQVPRCEQEELISMFS